MRESTKFLTNLGEHTLSCISCKKELVNIVKVLESEKKVRYVAICPCGGRSFTYETTGQIYLGVVVGKVIDDVDYDETKNEHTVRLLNVKT